MFRIKIFLKTSVKKLKRLAILKKRDLKSFICFLSIERNKHYDIIKKHLLSFILYIKTKSDDGVLINKLINNLFIENIEYLNSKKLKRLNIRAKGRADVITKRNSYLIITISKNKDLYCPNLQEKNYLIKNYGKKN